MSLHPAALAAADWWTEKVTGVPSRRAVTGNEPRADREPVEFAAMLSLMALPEVPNDAAAEKFRAVLAEHIDGLLQVEGTHISIGCDYGPDRTLADAAEAAGVSFGRFPWKTHMWIRPDHVTAAEGYRAQDQIVWHAENWDRPECDSQEWPETGDYGPSGRVCREPRFHDGSHVYVVSDAACGDCGAGLSGHTYGVTGHAFKAAAS